MNSFTVKGAFEPVVMGYQVLLGFATAAVSWLLYVSVVQPAHRCKHNAFESKAERSPWVKATLLFLAKYILYVALPLISLIFEMGKLKDDRQQATESNRLVKQTNDLVLLLICNRFEVGVS
jgi:hypothetical protein